MTKTCTKCKRVVPITDFAADKTRRDGVHCWCNSCRHKSYSSRYANKKYRSRLNAKNLQWHRENREASLAYKREYGKLPRVIAAVRLAAKAWDAGPSGRAWRKAWRRENAEKMRAHHAVRCAVKSGKLVRPEICSSCRRPCKAQAHHHKGYQEEHWLEVEWLCAKCHYRARDVVSH
jgi:hypothetical protein